MCVLLRESRDHFFVLSPGTVRPEHCESLPTHLENKKIIREKFLVRRDLSTQQASEMQELGNVHWIPGLGNLADGLARTKSDMVPLLRLLQSGVYNPGISPPIKDIAFNEKRFGFCT